MTRLIEKHGEVLNEIFEEAIEPILLEQQKITFMNEDDPDSQQLRGFGLAFRTLEQAAQKGAEKKNKREAKATKQ
jgi:hypothetical protein